MLNDKEVLERTQIIIFFRSNFLTVLSSKSWESVPKAYKIWESVPKVEKGCQKLRKYEQVWKKLQKNELKAEKVWESYQILK